MPSDSFPPGEGPGSGSGEGPRREPGFFPRQDYPARDPGFFQRGEIPPVDARRSGLIRLLAVAVSLGVFGFIVWYAYQQGHEAGSDSVPPIIKADVNPTRVRPESPGGMEVPHQDKLVYDRIDPGAGQPQVERLLPPPETPVSRPSRADIGGRVPAEQYPEPTFPETGKYPDIPVPTLPKEAPPQLILPPSPPQEAVTAAPPAPQALVPAPPAVPRSAVTAPPPPQAVPQPLAPAPQAVPQPLAPAPRAAPPKTVPKTAAAGGAYRIQLAAMRSEDSARKGWARLQRDNRDLLGNLNLTVQRVDLGAKGTFFRVQAGPLKSEAAARALCREMAKRNTGCLVVHP